MKRSPRVFNLLGDAGDVGAFVLEVGLEVEFRVGLGKGDLPNFELLRDKLRRRDGEDTVLPGDMAKKPTSPCEAIR